MASWDAAQATSELLAVLPLLNRIVGAAVRSEAGADTTVPQFRVLGFLLDGPLTASELARRQRVTLQSMGELVQVLVERELLTRVPSASDRRQQLLSLTEAGRTRYERAEAHALAQLTPVIARLSAEELAAVQAALPALHRVLAGEAS